MKKLEQKLGLGAVVAICSGAMLGPGIFVLPGLAASLCGPSVWLAYSLAAVGSLPAALSRVELATAIPTSGGTYIYIERTFGPLAGTVVGLGLWLSLLLKSAFALIGCGAYLAVLANLSHTATGLALLVLITVLNVVGVKRVGLFQMVAVGLSLVAFAAIAGLGASSVEPRNLEPQLPLGVTGLVSATAFVFVAFAGVTKIAAVAEDVESPARNLPLGTLLSLGLVTVIYAGITLVLVGTLPWDGLGENLRPIYTLAFAQGGPKFGTCAALLGVLCMTSMANAGLLAASRFPFAMSRDDLLPQSLKHVHPEYLTPVRCILLTSMVIGLSIAFLDVEKMAKLASSFLLMVYIAENAAVVALRESAAVWYRPPFRAPFYPVLQIFGIGSGFALLAIMGTPAAAACLVAVVPGLVLFIAYSRHRTGRRGVLAKVGRRNELITSGVQDAASGEPQVLPHGPWRGTSPSVLVGLLGRVRSPETLAEVGGALAEGGRIEVVHLTEYPEQTLLDDAEDEGVVVTSIRRRVEALGQEKGLDLTFEPAITHDLVKTVYDLCLARKNDWLVLEWQGRTRHRYGLSTPLGWLVSHLPCNLAFFRDRGVRHVRRIMVNVESGPHDALVATSADLLARTHGAELRFVAFAPDRSPPTLTQSRIDYLDQLRQVCQTPSGIELVRGAEEVSALVRATAAFDLVVTGAPAERTWRDALVGSDKDRLMEQAACSVVRLRTPRSRTHEAVDKGKPRPEWQKPFRLMEVLEPACVKARVALTRKEAVFRHIAETFHAAHPDDLDAKRLEEALWQRERLQITSVGMGLGLPHATLGEAPRSYLGLYTLQQPVDYGAPDGKLIDVLIVTLGPPRDRHAHLRLLSAVSKLVLKTPLLELLRRCETTEDCVAVLDDCGRQLGPI